MREYCENELCENPGFKEVRVSVDRPGDQVRTLCATCEEAYTWGVQHGTFSARAEGCLPNVEKLLDCGFVVLTRNGNDPSADGCFEAWAYRGPLSFQ